MNKRGYNVKVLADSMFFVPDSPKFENTRITTMELTYPRCIHSEFMTHRSHSRNAASSRAIPAKVQMMEVLTNPFIPFHWGKNQAGMVANEQFWGWRRWVLIKLWALLRYPALFTAWLMVMIGVHKQIANRLIEPWSWITVITTANYAGWMNFFKLRCHTDAEPHFQYMAQLARQAYDCSEWEKKEAGEYHLPLSNEIDRMMLVATEDLVKICVGRCARVSYLTHDGKRAPEKDIELHDRLTKNGHWSPFEHVCTFEKDSTLGGNLGRHVVQYRKTFPAEFGYEE